MTYDLIVIGGGPAGISASVYAKSRGLNVLLLEKAKVGGIVGNVSTVTHYAAVMPGETGTTFSARLEQQARDAGVLLQFENVTSVKLEGEEKKITTEKAVYSARAVILANGCTPRKLGIPGESELAGHGIGLNAARDGARYQGKNIYVIGGADGAVKEALYLSQFAAKLTIVCVEDHLISIQEFRDKVDKTPNISVKTETGLTAVFGTDHVEALEFTNLRTKEKERVEDDGCGIFIYAGTAPNTDLYQELQLEGGFIPVNDKMETGIPGVYAAGDIRVKLVRQVATAVSDGAVAGIQAAAYVS